MNNFSGSLYYDESDNEHLAVVDFIVRDDAVSFCFDSVSAAYGRLRAAGLARKVGDRVFRAEKVIALQHNVKADPWDVEFKVESLGDTLYVEGIIDADGSKHPFSGDLDLKVTVR